MIRYLLLILLLLTSCSKSYIKKRISDVVIVKENFTISRDTTLIGEYTIPNNVVVTIKPGVTVKMGINSKIVVSGSLIAIGTPEEPIVFTGIDGFDWKGIEYKNSMTKDFSILENVIVECNTNYLTKDNYKTLTLKSTEINTKSNYLKPSIYATLAILLLMLL